MRIAPGDDATNETIRTPAIVTGPARHRQSWLVPGVGRPAPCRRLGWEFDSPSGIMSVTTPPTLRDERRSYLGGVHRVNRRLFLKRAGLAAFGGTTVGGVYPFLEAKWCRVTPKTVVLPNLAAPFDGTTIALLSDIHHGPFVPLAYIRHAVAMTNALRPDIIALTGDFVHRHPDYIEPGIAALAKLKAAHGRFAVLGNHDNWESRPRSLAAIEGTGIELIDNRGLWLERGKARLRICGVGDLWTDTQDPVFALGDATPDDPVIMLSHNPDFAENLPDDRVGLMLSGHTHGGQVIIPGYGAPIVPSYFGQKYVYGLAQGPRCQVFTTRGVGTVSPPVRFLCRPEIALITLRGSGSMPGETNSPQRTARVGPATS